MSRVQSPPRYLVVAEAIRDKIRAGSLNPGERLPSEAALCEAEGISRGTAVRAIEQLVAEGIVIRQQGSGSFVANPSLYRRSGKLLSFSETARAGGHATHQKLIELVVASPEKAREFGCEPPALLMRRVRCIEGVACAIHTSVIPAAVARRVPDLAADDEAARGRISNSDFSLYAALEEAGMPVVEAEERVTTRLAEQDECTLLRSKPPTAVMVVFRRSLGARGELIEAVEAVYRSDFYAYDMHLVRGHPGRLGPKIEKTNAANDPQFREMRS